MILLHLEILGNGKLQFFPPSTFKLWVWKSSEDCRVKGLLAALSFVKSILTYISSSIRIIVAYHLIVQPFQMTL